MILQIPRVAVVLLAAGWSFGAQTASAVSAEGRYEAPGKVFQEMQPVEQHLKVADSSGKSQRQLIREAMTALQGKDYKRAMEKLLVVAEAGNAGAQYLVGLMHCNGHGVAKADRNTCISWLVKASQNGHEKAQKRIDLEKKLCSNEVRMLRLKSRLLRLGSDKIVERKLAEEELSVFRKCGKIIEILIKEDGFKEEVDRLMAKIILNKMNISRMKRYEYMAQKWQTLQREQEKNFSVLEKHCGEGYQKACDYLEKHCREGKDLGCASLKRLGMQ